MSNANDPNTIFDVHNHPSIKSAQPKPGEKMVRVRVAVPSRQPHNGFWAIQRHFAEGTSDYEIPESRLKELMAEKAIAVVPLPDAEPAKSELSPEEKKMADLLEKEAGLKKDEDESKDDHHSKGPGKPFAKK